MLRRVMKLFVGVSLLLVIASASMRADDKTKQPQATAGGESSPFIVGAWKLVCSGSISGNPATCPSPNVDTEFRFINPTQLTVTLEYAFFENNGTFCGCDRDTLHPNQTTVYTVSGERNNSPNSLMVCQGNSGALKSMVFSDVGIVGGIKFGGATQTGFQTHLFGNIQTVADFFGSSGTTSFANTMAEAGMKAIEINPVTVSEMNAIHQNCVKFLGN